MKAGRLALALLICLFLVVPSYADTFINGNFDTGDFTGWTQGGGYWYEGWPLNPNTYLPGGTNYDLSGIRNSIVKDYLDPNTDNQLHSVLTGNTYAAQINDGLNDNTVSVISQRVSNYTDPYVYFAWAAVLQGSHDVSDSDNFTIQLTDLTTGLDLYFASYSSASAAGTDLFKHSSSDWFYTDWQTEKIDVTSLSGHDFALTLLASDCPYGGHAGYVYLDGFGDAPPIPEPTTLALIGGGLALVAARLRRRN